MGDPRSHQTRGVRIHRDVLQLDLQLDPIALIPGLCQSDRHLYGKLDQDYLDGGDGQDRFDAGAGGDVLDGGTDVVPWYMIP